MLPASAPVVASANEVVDFGVDQFGGVECRVAYANKAHKVAAIAHVAEHFAFVVRGFFPLAEQHRANSPFQRAAGDIWLVLHPAADKGAHILRVADWDVDYAV